MRDNTSEKIEELTNKIEELTLAIKRLEDKERNKGNKVLEIGDRVRIKNPRNGQARYGRVCRIGKEFITVETKKGKVVRKIHNLQRTNSEDESVESDHE